MNTSTPHTNRTSDISREKRHQSIQWLFRGLLLSPRVMDLAMGNVHPCAAMLMVVAYGRTTATMCNRRDPEEAWAAVVETNLPLMLPCSTRTKDQRNPLLVHPMATEQLQSKYTLCRGHTLSVLFLTCRQTRHGFVATFKYTCFACTCVACLCRRWFTPFNRETLAVDDQFIERFLRCSFG